MVTDDEFIELFQSLGATKTASHLKRHIRNIYSRRRQIEAERGISLTSPISPGGKPRNSPLYPGRLEVDISDGQVVVGSDAHYWPGHISPAHVHFVAYIKKTKPYMVVMNGDVLDGATVSRHAPINWESRPNLYEEVEECKDRLGEIEKASKNSQLIWPLGNHDMRLESRLAQVAPEYAKMYGVHLKDHFPRWTPCWSLMINGDVMIKHRLRCGVHAAYNNTMISGVTTVTGHLHSLQDKPRTDYNGTRWGVDTGTLADPNGPQFDYAEDGPKDWRMGFVVLTFVAGRLLWPEKYWVREDGVGEFRGQEIRL